MVNTQSWKCLLFLAVLSARSISAVPQAPEPQSGLLNRVLITDDVFLLDAPAFDNPASPGETLATVQAFVFLRQVLPIAPIANLIRQVLGDAGVNVADAAVRIEERARFFVAVGLPGKVVSIKVEGCSRVGTTSPTALRDPGQTLSTVSLGTCTSQKVLSASVELTSADSRIIRASFFKSTNSGFGIISDIDDTVKESNVGNFITKMRSAFLDEAKPVSGMPQLYDSLSKTLPEASFFYITASPIQIVPFYNQFLDTNFPSATGPVFAQNLTVASPIDVVDFFRNDERKETHKLATIDLVRGRYPGKKWLMIGDSTERDPEIFGEAFRKQPSSVSCIWIRKVSGGNNTDARFSAAFAGVPEGRIKVFEDSEMASLASVDVAGGACSPGGKGDSTLVGGSSDTSSGSLSDRTGGTTLALSISFLLCMYMYL